MFSETVDIVCARSNRIDRIADIAEYVNNSVRQIHVFKDWHFDCHQELLYPAPSLHFGDGGIGRSSIIPSNMPHTHRINQHGFDRVSGRRHSPHSHFNYKWEIPTGFNKIKAVQYDRNCVVPMVQPGARQVKMEAYFYILGNDVVFHGFHREIAVWYFTWSQKLRYIKAGLRLAVFERDVARWMYNLAGTPNYINTLNNVELERVARGAVGNWILRDWQEVVIDGALMKLYRATQDDRAKVHEQAFREGLLDMRRSIGEMAVHNGMSNM